jgi:peroxiredoxin
MTGRWVIAGAAALGLGLAAIPFIANEAGVSAGAGGGAATTASADAQAGAGSKVDTAIAAGVCKATKKPARLDFTLKDMSGKSVNLADYKGKVVMLNFWATWCGPCQHEIPMFVQLQDQYRDKGVVFLGVSIDDEPETLRAYAQDMHMNYPVLVGKDHEIQDAYGPMFGIPTTMLISRDGIVCTRYSGARTKDKFESDIKALL